MKYIRHLLVGTLALGIFLLGTTSALARRPLSVCGGGGGTAAGQCNAPESAAVNQATGDVYIADSNDNRIDEFTQEGEFLRAFGWGVRDGQEESQTCTTASGCQDGLRGSGAGELAAGLSLAVGASGDVYVSESSNRRVQRFSPEGQFELMFGPDVTLSGPDNHTNDLTQTLTINTTTGSFDLCFDLEGERCTGGGGEGVFTAGSDIVREPANRSGSVPGPAGVRVGQVVEVGGGVLPPDTRVVAINRSEETLTLSAPANASTETQGVSITTGIPFDASAATVQGELDALATVGGAGRSVTVTGGPGNSNPYTIVFGGAFGGDVPMLSVTTFTGDVETPLGGSLSGGGQEVCKPAVGDACQSGSSDSGAGGFSVRSQLPIAVGAEADVWVGDDERAEEFSPEGTFLEEVHLPGTGMLPALAVDPLSESIYTIGASGNVGKVLKFSRGGLEGPGLDEGGSPRALGIDPASGDVFVADYDPQAAQPVSLFQYDATGAFLESFGTGGVLGQPVDDALAWSDAARGLYVASGEGGVQLFFPPPPGPQVQENSLNASPVKNVSAALNATIDPERSQTTYHFQYITERQFDEDGKSFGAGAKSTPESTSIGSDLSGHAVSVTIAGLAPETTYRFRAIATNANGKGNSEEEEATFTTLAPVAIESESVSTVTSASATLQAQIDPLGSDTTYYFQYGRDASYEEAVPVPPGVSLGSGEEPVPVSVHLQGLSAAATYHYRVVAVNALTGAEGRGGEDGTFTTQAAGSAVALPDGRQYELVSPPNKHGAWIYPIGRHEGSDIQVAAAGGAITYTTSGPFSAEPAGSRAVEPTQALSARTAPGSWTTADLTTPHDEGAAQVKLGGNNEYKLFSGDLSAGLVEPVGDTPLSPPVLPGETQERTPYYRSANGTYEPLVTAASVPEGTAFGGNEEIGGGLEFLAASPDLQHVVLQSQAPLVEGAPIGALYEWSAGRPSSEPLQLVGVLPPHGGKPETPHASLGYNNIDVRNAISDDGSRVIWQSTLTGTGASHQSYVGPLYMRDITRGETVQVDAAQGTAGPAYGESSPSRYATANGEGTRVFFTSRERLTTSSTSPLRGHNGYGSEDLYAFEITSGAGEPLAGTLTDLTVPSVGDTGFEGVIGASEDGAYVYFVAAGLLGSAVEPGAVSGGNNLYVEHYDEATHAWEAPRFIATLSKADAPSWQSPNGDLDAMTSRVSPNGRWLAFMSERSLTGYDNRDAVSGERDEEVFLYHAPEDLGSEFGGLACVSCDPTGARPVGIFERDEISTGVNPAGPLVDYDKIWKHRWYAADIPQWTPTSIGLALYQSRYLSNSGRLFFDSNDALVPGDVNGQQDVYEYEPAGVPAGEHPCAPARTSGGMVFKPQKEASSGLSEPAGCVALISAGASSEESSFLDASESGGDVFVLTTSKLSPQDFDTSYDIYDAHECSSESPCAPLAPLAPRSCETEASCRPAPSPQPAIYGAPSSETFSGAGNVASQPSPAAKRVQHKGKQKQKPEKKGKSRQCAKHGRCRRGTRANGHAKKRKGGK